MYFSEYTPAIIAYTLTTGCLALYFTQMTNKTLAARYLSYIFWAAAGMVGFGWGLASVITTQWHPLTIPYQFLGSIITSSCYILFANAYIIKTDVSFLEKLAIVSTGFGWAVVTTLYLYNWYVLGENYQNAFGIIALLALLAHGLVTYKFLYKVYMVENHINIFRLKTHEGRILAEFCAIHSLVYVLAALNIAFSLQRLSAFTYYTGFVLVFLISTMLTVRVYVSNDLREEMSLVKKLHIMTIIIAMIPITIASLYSMNMRHQNLLDQYVLLSEQSIETGDYQETLFLDYIRPLTAPAAILDLDAAPQSSPLLGSSQIQLYRDRDGELIPIEQRNYLDQIVLFTPDGTELGIDYLTYRQDLSRNSTTHAAVVIAAFLFIVFITPRLYRPIFITPINELTRAINRIEQGDEYTHIQIYQNDQIGQIGVAFNRMMVRINSYAQQMEDLVAYRTAELEKAKETAERASQAKSDFLARMSHELRTPLNSIMGYSQLLQEQEHDQALDTTSLQAIYKSGDHLLTLINDILDLAKIEEGKVTLERDEVYLPRFLDTVVDIMETVIVEKGLTFNRQFDSNLPVQILADEKRLRQILLNLLSNAAKFTNAGSVTLNICRLEYEDPNQAYLKFSIADTGSGIAQDQFQNIFLPFTQATAQNIQEFLQPTGTGLGLSISQQFVELMGGRINIQSQIDKGSTFSFELLFPILSAGHLAVKPVIEQQKLPFEQAQTQATNTAVSNYPLPQLEEIDIQNLIQFATWGDMDGIITYCNNLAKLSPTNDTFAQEVISLAENFADRRILNLLEQYKDAAATKAK